MILLARVHSRVTSEMAAGSKRSIAGRTNMLLFRNRILYDGDYLLRLHVGCLSGNLRLRVGGSVLIVGIIMGTDIFCRGFTRHA